MSTEEHQDCQEHGTHQCRCCPQCAETPASGPQWELSRRNFIAMGGVLLGGLTLAGMQRNLFAADAGEPVLTPRPRKPLVVKPVLTHDLPTRQEKTSWRNWGGIHTKEAAQEEVARINKELAELKTKADYPIEFMDVSAVTHINQMKGNPDMAACDTILVYGAGWGIDTGIQEFGKDVILFQRWKSGPVYLMYEIASPRFIRNHTDAPAMPGIRDEDVVTDSMDELNWRFRALCGLKNTIGSKIVTIGGAAAWAQPPNVSVPELVKKIWKFEYHDVNYNDLGKLINEARANEALMARSRRRAEAYLKIPGTKLETSGINKTNMDFLVNNFMLDEVFRMLMQQVGTDMLTVNSCMGTIMGQAQTSACMTLCLLNDDGYMAFCESDFVVIPSGVLLGNICGKPVFLNDPTYPHDHIITLAHCTGPRKMDGKNYDPVQIVTHFESDYGAAPHVEAQMGMVTTNIAPDFKSERWVGVKGVICDVPFRPICRTQFDIRYDCPDRLLAERMPGFHWMTCYGDYRKELGYALRRVGIQWDNLDEVPTKEMS